MMEFVLWGAGSRGRELRTFLGDRAVSFIDRNKNLQGTMQAGLPILSLEDFFSAGDRFRNAWVVLTTRSFIPDMERAMKAHGFMRYFILQQSPESFYEYDFDQIVARCQALSQGEDEVRLAGLDVFHIILYEELQKAGRHPVLVVREEDWEREATRIALLQDFDIRRTDAVSRPLVWDEELLRGLTNVYANPALAKFKNMYRGRRCFVVATGPSLRMEDLETLHRHGELCISMNGIFLAFPKVAWRPDFYMFLDFGGEFLHDHLDELDIPYKIISDENPEYWKESHPENVYKIHLMSGNALDAVDSFSDDMVTGCYCNGTVTNSCLQFATYLGCSEIYIIGLDFYKSVRTHFIEDYDNSMLTDEEAGLLPGYTEEHLANLFYRGFRVARRYADAHPPLKIYDATRDGYFDVFERRDFDTLFE